MELEIRLYATLRDKVGKSRIRIDVAEPLTVEALIEAVRAAHPEMSASLDSAVVSVNRAFANRDLDVHEGDEIAMFPPVSGGSSSRYPTYFSLASEPPDLNEINKTLVQPDVGAVVTFSGAVRGETQREGLPPETVELEYESYSEMALERMAQIAEEIWEKYPDVKGIAIVQRIGRLTVGDATTLVACAAGHRDQGAFEAARYGIDRLKEIVPVWKKEINHEQSVWVEGAYVPTAADNR